MLNSGNVVTSPVIAAGSTSMTDEREQPTKPIYVEVALLDSIEVIFFDLKNQGLVHYDTDRILEKRSDA